MVVCFFLIGTLRINSVLELFLYQVLERNTKTIDSKSKEKNWTKQQKPIPQS